MLCVRPALPRDRQALAELLSPPPAPLPSTPAAVLLVAERHQAILGTITICAAESARDQLPAGWWVVRDLHVRPDSRGNGLGAALLEEAVARARLSGAVALAVHMLPSMTAAIDLGQSFGFGRAPALDRRLAGSAADHILQAYVLPLRRPMRPPQLAPSLTAAARAATCGDHW